MYISTIEDDEAEICIAVVDDSYCIGIGHVVVEIEWEEDGSWDITGMELLAIGREKKTALVLDGRSCGAEGRIFAGTSRSLLGSQAFRVRVEEEMPEELSVELMREDRSERAHEMSRRI